MQSSKTVRIKAHNKPQPTKHILSYSYMAEGRRRLTQHKRHSQFGLMKTSVITQIKHKP